jgi:ABC-2 type transport system permease protein
MRDHPLVQLTLCRMREFYREPEAIFWVFGFPIVLAFALGIAFRNRGPGELNVAVLRETMGGGGGGGTADSALVATLDRSPRLAAVSLDSAEARQRLRTGRVALVVVPGDPLVYRYDSTRTESRLARLEVDDVLQRARGRTDPAAVRDDRVADPGSRYIDFLIPGLLGMNLLGSGIWGVGFSVVQARQKKLLKRFMATPMRRSHYLLGFILSRLLFLCVEVVALIGFGRLMFGVGVRGSWAALAAINVLGALSFAGLGLLVASRARTIEAVSGLMNLTMLPMWVLSGTFFSYARFPEVMQPFVKALPLTALNDALRAVMIDGAAIARLGAPLAVVAVWGLASFALALKIFRWR